MAFSLVWSLGYLISLIVFSVIAGLIFHFNETSKKTLAIYVVISLVFTSAVVYLINLFKNQLYSAIGVYNYTFLFLIAFVLIFSGYLLSKEKNFKDSFKKVLSLSYLCFLLIVFVCILSKTDLLGLNSLQLCLFTAILFNLLVATIFFLVKKFSFNRSFTVLRDLFFVFGLYFLIVSLLLPNIISLDMNDMRPINIASVESMVVTFVFLIAVAVLGLWYYRKNTLFKK